MTTLHTTNQIKKALTMAGATLALSGAFLVANVNTAEASEWEERPLDKIELDVQADLSSESSESFEYTIQWGDTLGNIAEAVGIELSVLVNANGIADQNLIIAGETLVITESVDATGEKQVEVQTEQQAQEQAPVEVAPVTPAVQEVAPEPEPEPAPAPVETPAPAPVQEAKAKPIAGTSQAKQAFNNIVASKGVSQSDADKWAYIINKESSWNPSATNPSSGAYGLAQSLPASKMASHGDIHDPNVQLSWMYDYMMGRYGSISGAHNHSVNTGWY